jgi:hypothetical protein
MGKPHWVDVRFAQERICWRKQKWLQGNIGTKSNAEDDGKIGKEDVNNENQ